jgi:hypothetical protein
MLYRRRATQNLARRPRIRDQLVRYWHMATFLCSLIIILWSIIAIEATLGWNAVTEIYIITSTGQLIPFIVGIAGIVRVTFLLISRWQVKVSDIWQRKRSETKS